MSGTVALVMKLFQFVLVSDHIIHYVKVGLAAVSRLLKAFGEYSSEKGRSDTLSNSKKNGESPRKYSPVPSTTTFSVMKAKQVSPLRPS